MLEIHRMMSESVLSVMGQGAFLRGEGPVQINVEHGVQITGLEDNIVSERDVATISTDLSPRKGDILTHPDGNYELDKPLQDNGVNQRWILIPV